MKKFVSILLVAMLILSLFPATAMPAKAVDYEAATSIATGDTVVIAYTTGKKEFASTFSGSGTKTYNPGTSYTGTVPTGVAPLTVEDGSTAGTYALKTADGKYLSWSSGNYLLTTTTKNANSSWKISFSGSNAIIANASDNSRKIQWNNSSPRFSCYTGTQKDIQLFKAPSGPSCEHPNAYGQGDGSDAGCTTIGKTDSIYCPDCEKTITPQQDIPALGHTWGATSCTVCGEPKPEGLLPVSQLVSGEYVIAATTKSKGSYALPKTIASKMSGQKVTVDSGAVLVEEGLPYWTVTVVDGGVTLRNADNKYLAYGSGTNFTTSTSAYTWAVAAGENGFTLTASGRALAFQANDGSNDQLRYGAYSTNQTNGEYVFELNFYTEAAAPAEPVINGYVGGAWVGFPSVEAALSETSTLQLISENTPAIECQGGNLYLDLNGHDATVTADKIYAYDSTATTSSTEFGTLTTTSNVEFDYTANNKRYIALKDGNAYTFHVLDLKLTGVTLRTTAAGIYYKATVVCDSTLLGKITNYGVLLSTNGAPTEFDNTINAWTNVANQGEKALTSGTEFTSGSVFGIFKDGKDNAARGATPIYANAYIQVDGQTLLTDASAACSMQYVVSQVNNMNFSTMKPELYNSLDAFYDKWETVLCDWGMDNMSDTFGNPN